jgi:hypothetical protein
MSHYTRIRTRLVDQEALLHALRAVGLAQIEVHDEPQHLYGFMGDRRPQRAEVIIRRRHVGRASNDIGFARTATGGFEAIISGFDRAKYDARWLDRLTQHYAHHVTRRQLEAQGFTLVEEEKCPDGRIRLTVRRAA